MKGVRRKDPAEMDAVSAAHKEELLAKVADHDWPEGETGGVRSLKTMQTFFY